jgi:hypothetical protein
MRFENWKIGKFENLKIMKKSLFMALVLTLVCSTGIIRADELGPLYDGNNSSGEYVPLQGGFVDRCQRVQVIYPKGDLAAIAGKSITKMTFYVKTKAAAAWNAGIEIALAETDESNFDAANVFKDADFTTVYNGTDLNALGDEMEVVFSKPFEFSGTKNLLFELRIKGHGATWKKAIFYAKGGYDNQFSIFRVATSDTEEYDELTTGTSRYYARPKTKFTYEDSTPSSCAKPTALSISIVEAKSASLQWSFEHEAEKVQYALVEGTDEPSEWSEPTADASKDLTGLKPETKYTFYLRSWCSAEDQSDPIKVAFTTEKACFEPVNIQVSNIGANSALVTWDNSTHGEINYEFAIQPADNVLNWEVDAKSTSDYKVELTDLLPETEYIVYVRSLCDGGDKSAVVSALFKTTCGAITSLPFSEDFEGLDSGLPSCWSRLSESSYPQVSTLYRHELWFSFGETASQIAVLPEFATTMSLLSIKLEYSTKTYETADEATLEIGYLTDANDAATFAAVESFGKADGYKKVLVALTEAPTEATHIALRATAANAIVHVDNVLVALTEDFPTNVESVEASKVATKRIEDGQLVIIREGVKYNAIGTVK